MAKMTPEQKSILSKLVTICLEREELVSWDIDWFLFQLDGSGKLEEPTSKTRNILLEAWDGYQYAMVDSLSLLENSFPTDHATVMEFADALIERAVDNQRLTRGDFYLQESATPCDLSTMLSNSHGELSEELWTFIETKHRSLAHGYAKDAVKALRDAIRETPSDRQQSIETVVALAAVAYVHWVFDRTYHRYMAIGLDESQSLDAAREHALAFSISYKKTLEGREVPYSSVESALDSMVAAYRRGIPPIV